jgi:hypothetical protein
MFFSVSHHISCTSIWVSHFFRFLVFSPYSRYYCVTFTFFTFSVFLAIFQVYSVYVLYFTCFTVSHHIPGPTVWLSHFSRFQCFAPYSRSYSVCVSFSTFFCFLYLKNDKYTSYDLEYGQNQTNKKIKKTEKWGKWDTHTVGLGM